MAKKKTTTPLRKATLNVGLERPVATLLGYIVLLLLAIVVLLIVYSLQWFIIPFSGY